MEHRNLFNIYTIYIFPFLTDFNCLDNFVFHGGWFRLGSLFLDWTVQQKYFCWHYWE